MDAVSIKGESLRDGYTGETGKDYSGSESKNSLVVQLLSERQAVKIGRRVWCEPSISVNLSKMHLEIENATLLK